ncbi:MAG: lipid-binding SYLF domain-containing protein [Alphaproteobacteria bacterium]
MNMIRLIALLLTVTFGVSACHGPEGLQNEPEKLIDNAAATAKAMYSNPEYATLLNLTNRARGVLIVPSMLRASFIWGARTGNGVLLTRDASGSGGWSQPAFYTLGGVNWGLQAGVQEQEIIIVIMTERGLNAVIDRRVTLGADASVAAGELGKGYNAATGVGINADMYTFAKTAGLYAGISLDGSWIEPRDSWNKLVYGDAATARGIVIDRSFTATNSQAAQNLVSALP